MKESKNNQIMHDMYIEDLKQVENLAEIGFEVGSFRQEYKTSKRIEFGKPYYFIKSAGIYFPISEDSADAIISKMARLANLKKYVEESKGCVKNENNKRDI